MNEFCCVLFRESDKLKIYIILYHGKMLLPWNSKIELNLHPFHYRLIAFPLLQLKHHFEHSIIKFLWIYSIHVRTRVAKRVYSVIYTLCYQNVPILHNKIISLTPFCIVIYMLYRR